MGTALLSFERNLASPRLARSVWYMGGLMTVHADSADTKGALALLEFTGGPGGEPPLHVHENEDELFYVIEGRLKIFRGGEEFIVEAGDSAFMPRRIPHTFKILSSQARGLVYITPAGFEEYFRTIGRPAQKLTLDPNPPAPDYQRIAQVAQQFGVRVLV
jgi:quercetin dioxygenase-like cupin family protein